MGGGRRGVGVPSLSRSAVRALDAVTVTDAPLLRDAFMCRRKAIGASGSAVFSARAGDLLGRTLDATRAARRSVTGPCPDRATLPSAPRLHSSHPPHPLIHHTSLP